MLFAPELERRAGYVLECLLLATVQALRELRKCDRELRTVADLISIKGIGAGIAGELIGTVEAVANGTFHAPDDIFSISKWLADLGLSQYDATVCECCVLERCSAHR